MPRWSANKSFHISVIFKVYVSRFFGGGGGGEISPHQHASNVNARVPESKQRRLFAVLKPAEI